MLLALQQTCISELEIGKSSLLGAGEEAQQLQVLTAFQNPKFGLQHPSLAFHSHQIQGMQGAQLFLLSPEGTCIQLHMLIYTFTLSENHELWNTLEIPAPRRQRWVDLWGLWLASLVCEMNFRPEKIPLSQITRWESSVNAINPNNEETRGWHIYVTLKPARTRVCLNNQVVSFMSIHIHSSELL